MNQPALNIVSARSGPAKFTAEEFAHMCEVGAFQDIKVELVEGEIERLIQPMNNHAARQAAILGKLWVALGARAADLVRGEVGIAISSSTVVACDVAILQAPVAEQRWIERDELLLVIEVAETSIDRDLGLKRRAYAEAGIENYWVADGARALTHVFSRPIDGEYCDLVLVNFDQPLAVPCTNATITIA